MVEQKKGIAAGMQRLVFDGAPLDAALQLAHSDGGDYEYAGWLSTVDGFSSYAGDGDMPVAKVAT